MNATTTNAMTNSHILVREFTYVEPHSLAETLTLLAEHGDAARLLAGGTDLLVQMKMERVKPQFVIGLRRVAELKGVRWESDRLVLGALTTIREIARSAPIRSRFPALSEACASLKVRTSASARSGEKPSAARLEPASPPAASFTKDLRVIVMAHLRRGHDGSKFGTPA